MTTIDHRPAPCDDLSTEITGIYRDMIHTAALTWVAVRDTILAGNGNPIPFSAYADAAHVSPEMLAGEIEALDAAGVSAREAARLLGPQYDPSAAGNES